MLSVENVLFATNGETFFSSCCFPFLHEVFFSQFFFHFILPPLFRYFDSPLTHPYIKATDKQFMGEAPLSRYRASQSRLYSCCFDG